MPIERFDLSDIDAIIGKTPDTAVNTLKTTTSLYERFRMNAMQPPLPEVQKIPDQMVGDGRERARILRKGWGIPNQLAIGGRLDAHNAAKLGMRNLGGTPVPTTLTLGQSYSHVTPTQTKSAGRIPKLSHIGFLLGGYDFLFPALAVNTYEISFDGSNDVNYSAGLINTGYYKRLADMATIVIGSVGSGNTPAYHLMHPAVTKVTFSNGATVDFALEGKLISGSCSNNNNVVVEQMPGDPQIDATDRTKGFYARDIHRTERDPQARVKVYMQSDLAEFTMAQSGMDVTSLTYRFESEDKIGTSDDYYAVEWKAPLAEVAAARSNPQNRDSAIDIEFYIKETGSTMWDMTVQSHQAALS